ncbi:MAG: VOC family protein [Pseudomonadota bacterium]
MIKSLSYLGFLSPNAQDWRSFAPDILGAGVVDAGDDVVRVRIDDAAWRIAIAPGDTNQLDYIGWDVGSAALLDTAIQTISDAGMQVQTGDETLALSRNVAGIAWFQDPIGTRHELTYGQMPGDTSFTPGHGISGFLTGEQGLGHIVLMVPDMQEATDFYMNLMGFRHSDDIEVGMTLRFFHCNPRHHTVALSQVPGHRGVHHVMLQVHNIDEVGLAYDRVVDAGLPIAMGIGRHPNDEMTSFYVRSPSGFEIEFGTGGLEIPMEEEWPVGQFDAMSIWGHKPPGEALMPGVLQPVD